MNNLLQFLYTIQPKSILDIGANNGDFSSYLKKVFPETFLFAIEANPNCKIDLTNKNIPHVICCLSDIEKNIDFFVSNLGDGKNTGASYYKEKTDYYKEGNYNTLNIRSKTLDSIFENSVTFDFIKLDTQGSEIDIIRGGINLVKRAKYLMLEVAILEYNENAPFIDEVFSYLESINYLPILKVDEHKYSDGIIFQEDWIFKNNDI
jgi:FkbM family methyltransferase